MISVYNIHHSPAVWDDAEAFQPERFSLDTPTPNEQNTEYRSAILAAEVHLLPAKLCVFKAECAECNAPTMPMMAQIVPEILNQSTCVLDCLYRNVAKRAEQQTTAEVKGSMRYHPCKTCFNAAGTSHSAVVPENVSGTSLLSWKRSLLWLLFFTSSMLSSLLDRRLA